jgi:hypothetical protein
MRGNPVTRNSIEFAVRPRGDIGRDLGGHRPLLGDERARRVGISRSSEERADGNWAGVRFGLEERSARELGEPLGAGRWLGLAKVPAEAKQPTTGGFARRRPGR